jgi:hypothetical protein
MTDCKLNSSAPSRTGFANQLLAFRFELIPTEVQLPRMKAHARVHFMEFDTVQCIIFAFHGQSCQKIAIGAFMRSNPFLSAAPQFLLPTVFDSNHLDCLWRMHCSLVHIHKSAAVHGAARKEQTETDATKILPLDDLFSRFFVILISPQVPHGTVIARMAHLEATDFDVLRAKQFL